MCRNSPSARELTEMVSWGGTESGVACSAITIATTELKIGIQELYTIVPLGASGYALSAFFLPTYRLLQHDCENTSARPVYEPFVFSKEAQMKRRLLVILATVAPISVA